MNRKKLRVSSLISFSVSGIFQAPIWIRGISLGWHFCQSASIWHGSCDFCLRQTVMLPGSRQKHCYIAIWLRLDGRLVVRVHSGVFRERLIRLLYINPCTTHNVLQHFGSVNFCILFAAFLWTAKWSLYMCKTCILTDMSVWIASLRSRHPALIRCQPVPPCWCRSLYIVSRHILVEVISAYASFCAKETKYMFGK